MPKLEKKDVRLFWLNRHIQEIERQVSEPSQLSMAEQRLPYEQRQKVAEEAAKRAETRKVELESLLAIRQFVEDHG